jgi:hypothetical protein
VTIHLKPELEALIAEIAAKIEHGFAQAERDELIEGDEAFRQLRQRRERDKQR